MQGSVLGEFSELLCGANLISTHLSHSQPLFPSSKALLHFASFCYSFWCMPVPKTSKKAWLQDSSSHLTVAALTWTNFDADICTTSNEYVKDPTSSTYQIYRLMLCAKKGLKSTGVRESLLFAITHWASTRSTTQRASQRNFNISHRLIY